MDQEKQMNKIAFPKFTKKNPSPNYQKLIGMYEYMHKNGMKKFNVPESKSWVDSKNVFPGKKTLQHAEYVKMMCDHYNAKTLLDFGAGKSEHYNLPIKDKKGKSYINLQDYWGLNEIKTYEPALGYKIPNKKFDAVICTDVIEHVFFGDVFWTIKELFLRAKKFVYVNISCDLTKTVLPNGENVHVTVRKPEYWHGVLDTISSEFPGIDYVLVCASNPAVTLGKKEFIFFQRINFNKLGNKLSTH